MVYHTVIKIIIITYHHNWVVTIQILVKSTRFIPTMAFVLVTVRAIAYALKFATLEMHNINFP